MKKLLTIISAAALLFVSGANILIVDVASAAVADNKAAVCEGVGLTGGNSNCTGGDTAINTAVQTTIRLLSIIVGVISVIMIIIGGLKYITSAGDSAKVNSAKNTILYAVIGLVAQVIVRFVLNKV